MPGKPWTQERKDALREKRIAQEKQKLQNIQFYGYFERQHLSFCAKHALNNLFRNCGYGGLNKLCFGTEDKCINLDEICDEILEEAMKNYNLKDAHNASVKQQYVDDHACDPEHGNYKDEVIQAALERADCTYERFFPTISVDGK